MNFCQKRGIIIHSFLQSTIILACLFILFIRLLLQFRSKLDHLIVCMALENAERSAVDSTKRALGRIFSCLHHDPSVLILFTGTSEKTLDGEKPGSEFSIYQRRNSLTNTIHCHRAREVSIDNVNSALFWTVHKHLKKICGVDPQVVEELQPFHNSRSELKFGKDYSINVVSHDL